MGHFSLVVPSVFVVLAVEAKYFALLFPFIPNILFRITPSFKFVTTEFSLNLSFALVRPVAAAGRRPAPAAQPKKKKGFLCFFCCAQDESGGNNANQVDLDTQRPVANPQRRPPVDDMCVAVQILIFRVLCFLYLLVLGDIRAVIFTPRPFSVRSGLSRIMMIRDTWSPLLLIVPASTLGR